MQGAQHPGYAIHRHGDRECGGTDAFQGTRHGARGDGGTEFGFDFEIGRAGLSRRANGFDGKSDSKILLAILFRNFTRQADTRNAGNPANNGAFATLDRRAWEIVEFPVDGESRG